MRPYRLPLFERSITITEEEHGVTAMGIWAPYQTCLHIDEVGVFIYHDGKQPLTTNLIRHYIPLRRRTECIVDATSVEDAIRKFYDTWEGANVGGQSEEAKALWIDRKGSDGKPSHELIWELPECTRMHVNNRGGITCGRPIHSITDHPEKDDESWNSNGEFGMCGLDGYDYPETNKCPMNKWQECRTEYPLPIRTITAEGKEYHYISERDFLEAAQRKKEKEIADERSKRVQSTHIYKRLKHVEL